MVQGGRKRSRTQESGHRSQDSASGAISRRPGRVKPLRHEDNVGIHRPRSPAAERLPTPVQGTPVSSAESWGCTPRTRPSTQHCCKTQVCSHRLADTRTHSLPLKRKSHFFPTSPRGRRASDLLKEEEQQPGAHRLHVLRSCVNTGKKCLHFLS